MSCLAFCLGPPAWSGSPRRTPASLAPQGESARLRLEPEAGRPGRGPGVRRRAQAARTAPRGSATEPPLLQSWQEIRDTTANLVKNQRRALLTGGWLLGLLALASVAVLVGGRMADQIRRVGLLKAVGGTPSLVAAVLLAEYVVVALLAAAAGLAVGWLAAPLLTDPSAGLLGGAGAPPLTISTVGLVTAVALGVAVAATFVPAVRAARTSTVLALADSARAPRRTAWLIALSARLPVPLLLGLRVAARRPRRVVLATASIAITVSGIVAALAAHADLDATQASGRSDPSRTDRLNQVLLVITITLARPRGRQRDLHHLGDRARRQTLIGARARARRDPAAGQRGTLSGTGASRARRRRPRHPGRHRTDRRGRPRPDDDAPAALAAARRGAGTVLVVAGLTAIPARIGARRPVAETLESELA